MIRPREALARRCAHIGLCTPDWRHDAGAGRTIALIDGIPDHTIDALAGADLEVRRIGVEADAPPDEHATHGASLLVDPREGVAPGARLLAAGVTAADSSIAAAAVAAAIAWATERRADIIVVPLGDHQAHPEISAAIAAALSSGILVVAAAGNAHPREVLYPARLPGVLAVGACDDDGALLESCCRAPRLDLVVPALAVVAAVGPGRSAAHSGTSVAATLAGGLLSLDFLDPHRRRRQPRPIRRSHD